MGISWRRWNNIQATRLASHRIIFIFSSFNNLCYRLVTHSWALGSLAHARLIAIFWPVQVCHIWSTLQCPGGHCPSSVNLLNNATLYGTASSSKIEVQSDDTHVAHVILSHFLQSYIWHNIILFINNWKNKEVPFIWYGLQNPFCWY